MRDAATTNPRSVLAKDDVGDEPIHSPVLDFGSILIPVVLFALFWLDLLPGVEGGGKMIGQGAGFAISYWTYAILTSTNAAVFVFNNRKRRLMRSYHRAMRTRLVSCLIGLNLGLVAAALSHQFLGPLPINWIIGFCFFVLGLTGGQGLDRLLVSRHSAMVRHSLIRPVRWDDRSLDDFRDTLQRDTEARFGTLPVSARQRFQSWDQDRLQETRQRLDAARRLSGLGLED